YTWTEIPIGFWLGRGEDLSVVTNSGRGIRSIDGRSHVLFRVDCGLRLRGMR
ncbi:hypothetical protein SK128_012521, partial [Halocaridina rubra]